MGEGGNGGMVQCRNAGMQDSGYRVIKHALASLPANNPTVHWGRSGAHMLELADPLIRG